MSESGHLLMNIQQMILFVYLIPVVHERVHAQEQVKHEKREKEQKHGLK